jgi:hypothetical protein
MSKNPLVGTKVTSKRRVEDLVLWEIERKYCRTAVDLSAGTYVVGQVLTNESPAASSAAAGHQPTFSDVLCLQNLTIPSGQTREVAVLARGPALVNLDEVERATTDESDADLKTRLADLIAQGVRFIRETAINEDSDLDA